MGTDRLVVLARGLGTRMRKEDSAAALSDEQSRIADTGLKAMIPIDRPFLDYVLNEAADAGFRRVCMVIGREHVELRNYYSCLNSSRLAIDFAIQDEPLGTANAVAAAEAWTNGEQFVVINSDNYYPAAALRSIRDLAESGATLGVAVFDRDAMLSGSNIPRERIEKFAIARLRSVSGRDLLTCVIEKPTDVEMQSVAAERGGKIYLSMNLWLMDNNIFAACRAIPKSVRGEYEITDAVQHAIDRPGVAFWASLVHAPVLDLSSRADIEPVAERLRGLKITL